VLLDEALRVVSNDTANILNDLVDTY